MRSGGVRLRVQLLAQAGPVDDRARGRRRRGRAAAARDVLIPRLGPRYLRAFLNNYVTIPFFFQPT